MIETLIRKSTPIGLSILTLALTVGTAFAQEGESSSGVSGLATAILLLGVAAIAGVFFVNWSQSTPNDSDQ